MIPLVWVWIWDGRQHRVTHPLLFTNNVWVLNVPQTLLYVQGVVRRVYRQGFFEKTRESNRFQTFYKDDTFYSVKDPECWTRKNLNRSGLPLCRVALTQQPGNIRIFSSEWHHRVLRWSFTTLCYQPRFDASALHTGRWIRKGHFIRWTYCA